jgi:hypothetical protein
VLKRWRWASSNQQASLDDGAREPRAADVRTPDQAAAPPLQPAPAAEPSRPSLLKRPLGDRLDISRAFQAPQQARRLTET